MCGAPAAAKIGEEIMPDDPHQNRHNLTAYVCYHHARWILLGEQPPAPSIPVPDREEPTLKASRRSTPCGCASVLATDGKVHFPDCPNASIPVLAGPAAEAKPEYVDSVVATAREFSARYPQSTNNHTIVWQAERIAALEARLNAAGTVVDAAIEYVYVASNDSSREGFSTAFDAAVMAFSPPPEPTHGEK
jgi:hypothetical protein